MCYIRDINYGAVAQLGEHHTCTVGVAGSIPVSSTHKKNRYGKLAERLKASGCKPDSRMRYGGSNPSLTTLKLKTIRR